MRRVTRLRWILVTVIAVLAVLIAGAAVAVLRYQPLESRGGAFGMDVIGPDGSPAPNAVTRRQGIVFPSEALATVKTLGSQVVLDFPIGNPGRFSVRLTEVRSPGDARLFAARNVSMGNAHAGWPDRPFRPVTLKPHDIRTIEIRGRPRCLETLGTRITFNAASVEYGFLGVRHTALIPIHDYGFAVAGIRFCG